MQQWLTRRWYGDSAPLALRPLSWLFGAMVASRRALYHGRILRVHRVGSPVVVIGNLTVGGTGKTPLVIWLAQQLSARGMRVGVVSRGFGRRGHTARMVEPTADWREVGDEPLLIRRATDCLTVVAADRVAGARLLVDQKVDAVIADDGLQHVRLARDCEIAVIDGTRGFGNGWLLPAGPLREPASRLAGLDAIVVNGAVRPSVIAPARNCLTLEMTLASSQVLPLSAAGKARPLESFRNERVHAVAGIGNPARFFADLRAHGIDVIEHPFADHHAFTAADLRFDDEMPRLMTEKDAVKCHAFANSRMGYVPVNAQFSESDAQRLLARVLQKLGLLQTQ